MHSIKSNVQSGQVKLQTHLLCILLSVFVVQCIAMLRKRNITCLAKKTCLAVTLPAAMSFITGNTFQKVLQCQTSWSAIFKGKSTHGQWHNLESKPSSKVSQSLVVGNPVARLFLDGEYQAINSMHSPYKHQCNWKKLATSTFYLSCECGSLQACCQSDRYLP